MMCIMADDQFPRSAGAAYDVLAAAYAATVDTKPYNAYYERPATLSLLPHLRGWHVVDAGCGAGTYTEWLVSQGADVVAFDASAEMVRFTQQRVGDTARVLQADLGQPLTFLEQEAVDLVLSPLALDYVQDWHATFSEFYRVLRPHGYLVFSVNHPFFDYLDFQATDYFATHAVHVEYGSLGAVQVPTFRRPLSAIVDPLVDTGFMLERLLEPRPTKAFQQHDPTRYEELLRRPMFVCVRAKKM
jgi:SAM-dependent methyltransferase